MPLSRQQLSTYTDGSFKNINYNTDTLMHTASETGTQYVYILMYNQGVSFRDIILKIGDTEMKVRVQPTKRSQQVLPGLRLYNMGNGINISCSPLHANAWTFPEYPEGTIIITNGYVSYVDTSFFSCTHDNVPVLLHVTDSRRTEHDVSISKGTIAVVELNRNNEFISAQILDAGNAFDQNYIQVDIRLGIIGFGYVLSE